MYALFTLIVWYCVLPLLHIRAIPEPEQHTNHVIASWLNTQLGWFETQNAPAHERNV